MIHLLTLTLLLLAPCDSVARSPSIRVIRVMFTGFVLSASEGGVSDMTF
jgi:hypothetical protein